MAKGKILHNNQLQINLLDHKVQSSAVKGVFWTQPVLTKDKGAARPSRCHSFKIPTTKNATSQLFGSLL